MFDKRLVEAAKEYCLSYAGIVLPKGSADIIGDFNQINRTEYSLIGAACESYGIGERSHAAVTYLFTYLRLFPDQILPQSDRNEKYVLLTDEAVVRGIDDLMLLDADQSSIDSLKVQFMMPDGRWAYVTEATAGEFSPGIGAAALSINFYHEAARQGTGGLSTGQRFVSVARYLAFNERARLGSMKEYRLVMGFIDRNLGKALNSSMN